MLQCRWSCGSADSKALRIQSRYADRYAIYSTAELASIHNVDCVAPTLTAPKRPAVVDNNLLFVVVRHIGNTVYFTVERLEFRFAVRSFNRGECIVGRLNGKFTHTLEDRRHFVCSTFAIVRAAIPSCAFLLAWAVPLIWVRKFSETPKPAASSLARLIRKPVDNFSRDSFISLPTVYRAIASPLQQCYD